MMNLTVITRSSYGPVRIAQNPATTSLSVQGDQIANLRIVEDDPYSGNLFFQGPTSLSSETAIYFIDRGPQIAVTPLPAPWTASATDFAVSFLLPARIS
jgi:hypothetical protein